MRLSCVVAPISGCSTSQASCRADRPIPIGLNVLQLSRRLQQSLRLDLPWIGRRKRGASVGLSSNVGHSKPQLECMDENRATCLSDVQPSPFDVVTGCSTL